MGVASMRSWRTAQAKNAVSAAWRRARVACGVRKVGLGL